MNLGDGCFKVLNNKLIERCSGAAKCSRDVTHPMMYSCNCPNDRTGKDCEITDYCIAINIINKIYVSLCKIFLFHLNNLKLKFLILNKNFNELTIK